MFEQPLNRAYTYRLRLPWSLVLRGTGALCSFRVPLLTFTPAVMHLPCLPPQTVICIFLFAPGQHRLFRRNCDGFTCAARNEEAEPPGDTSGRAGRAARG
jgi:hypothetical protein